MDSLAALFVDPIPLTGMQRAIMLLPICLSISVVYKTIKCPRIEDIARTSATLWVTIFLGMWAVAFALWLLYQLFA